MSKAIIERLKGLQRVRVWSDSDGDIFEDQDSDGSYTYFIDIQAIIDELEAPATIDDLFIKFGKDIVAMSQEDLEKGRDKWTAKQESKR